MCLLALIVFLKMSKIKLWRVKKYDANPLKSKKCQTSDKKLTLAGLWE